MRQDISMCQYNIATKSQIASFCSLLLGLFESQLYHTITLWDKVLNFSVPSYKTVLVTLIELFQRLN
jgi:hypothetical protein